MLDGGSGLRAAEQSARRAAVLGCLCPLALVGAVWLGFWIDTKYHEWRWGCAHQEGGCDG